MGYGSSPSKTSRSSPPGRTSSLSLPSPSRSPPASSNSRSPTSTNDESVRKEGILKTLHVQEWTNSEYANDIIDILTSKKRNLNSTHVSDILSKLDGIAVSNEIISEYIEVMDSERSELSNEISSITESITDEELKVKELRQTLRNERKVVDQRLQLEGVAKTLLKLPKQDTTKVQIDQLNEQLGGINENIKCLQNEKVKLAKELNLLLHCTKNISQSGSIIHRNLGIASDVSTSSQQATASTKKKKTSDKDKDKDAMDTS